jgi:hypothetical protein
MYVNAYSLIEYSYVGRGLVMGWSPFKEFYLMSKGLFLVAEANSKLEEEEEEDHKE